MKHLGDYDASTVIYGKFTTFRPSSGAPFTLAGTPALSVYKDNSTTQSTSGVTLTVDFDSVTGLHHYAIDTSADGAFYAAGSFFDIVITTGTVDSVSVVGTVVASFTIRKDSGLKPTTAGRTLDVTAGGEAGIDWANIGSPTTTVNLSGTTVKTATDVETDTADIQSRLPAALVSGRIDASVGAMATGVMTAAALAADAAAEIADAVWDEILSGHAVSGSTGEALSAAGGAGDPWITALPGSYSSGQAGYILGTYLDAAVSTRSTYAGGDTAGTTTLLARLTATRAGYLDNLSGGAVALASSILDAAGLRSALGLASANLDTQLSTIDTVVDAVKAKTDLLAFTGGAVDANVTAVNDSTGAGVVLERVVRGNVRGTVDAGASTTSIPTSSLSPAAAVADQFKGRIVVFDDNTTTAALRGQATDITANTSGGTLTVTALTTAPTSGDTFTIS